MRRENASRLSPQSSDAYTLAHLLVRGRAVPKSEAPQTERQQKVRSRVVGGGRWLLLANSHPPRLSAREHIWALAKQPFTRCRENSILYSHASLLFLIQMTKNRRRGPILNPSPFLMAECNGIPRIPAGVGGASFSKRQITKKALLFENFSTRNVPFLNRFHSGLRGCVRRSPPCPFSGIFCKFKHGLCACHELFKTLKRNKENLDRKRTGNEKD